MLPDVCTEFSTTDLTWDCAGGMVAVDPSKTLVPVFFRFFCLCPQTEDMGALVLMRESAASDAALCFALVSKMQLCFALRRLAPDVIQCDMIFLRSTVDVMDVRKNGKKQKDHTYVLYIHCGKEK
mmetsp:Transcript_20032/g.26480  ORF Transcript_20032/g.26480 Transcript_20032/m.26480 type:complete len:125 (+) Transcript_20032:3124-3498(+)